MSQTTTRLDAPNPVTYAFTEFSFWLAFMRNIRSRGISSAPRRVTFSISDTRAGALVSSGSNSKNRGSMTKGETKTRNTITGREAMPTVSHQRRVAAQDRVIARRRSGPGAMTERHEETFVDSPGRTESLNRLVVDEARGCR